MTATPRPVIQMIWTRSIDGQPMAGRLRLATAIRAALRNGGTVREHVLQPAIANPRISDILGAAWAWCRSVFAGPMLPFQCVLYASPAEVRRAVAAITPDVDVIYLDGVRTFVLLRALRRAYPDCRIVMDLDDLMSRRMALLREARQPLSPGYLASRLPPRLVRWLTGSIGQMVVRYESRTLPEVEAAITRQADTVVLLSSEDMRAMPGLNPAQGGAQRATISPMVICSGRAPVLEPGPIRFIFIGSDSLTQNRLTIDYLLDLWKRYRFDADLVIFGRQARKVPLPARVSMPGYAEQIDDVYDGHSVLVTPSFLRGGIKTKVLEAFAHGTPVIGNEATFEAMPLQDYPLLIDGEEKLVAVLANPEAWREQLSDAARRGMAYVREHHSPAEFERRWHALMQAGSQSSGSQFADLQSGDPALPPPRYSDTL